MEDDPIAGPSTSYTTRSSPSKPVLDNSWTQVEILPDADDSDYEQDEEVEYVTLDFGSDLPPEILSQLETFQLASLNSKQPWARLGDNFLRGVHERTLGSDVLFISRPPDPDTGKPTLLEPLTTSSSRIRFEKVILTPKTSTNSSTTPAIERPSASAFLAPPKRGVRGGSGYKAGGGPGGGANRGKKNAAAITNANAGAVPGTRKKRGQKDVVQEEEVEEELEEEGNLEEKDGEADYKEATPDTPSASTRKTRIKKSKEPPATSSSEARKTRSRGKDAPPSTSIATLPPLPPPEVAAQSAPAQDGTSMDAPPLDEVGISQFLREQDIDMANGDEVQASTSTAFIGLPEAFPDIEEF